MRVSAKQAHGSRTFGGCIQKCDHMQRTQTFQTLLTQINRFVRNEQRRLRLAADVAILRSKRGWLVCLWGHTIRCRGTIWWYTITIRGFRLSKRFDVNPIIFQEKVEVVVFHDRKWEDIPVEITLYTHFVQHKQTSICDEPCLSIFVCRWMMRGCSSCIR